MNAPPTVSRLSVTTSNELKLWYNHIYERQVSRVNKKQIHWMRVLKVFSFTWFELALLASRAELTGKRKIIRIWKREWSGNVESPRQRWREWSLQVRAAGSGRQQCSGDGVDEETRWDQDQLRLLKYPRKNGELGRRVPRRVVGYPAPGFVSHHSVRFNALYSYSILFLAETHAGEVSCS